VPRRARPDPQPPGTRSVAGAARQVGNAHGSACMSVHGHGGRMQGMHMRMACATARARHNARTRHSRRLTCSMLGVKSAQAVMWRSSDCTSASAAPCCARVCALHTLCDVVAALRCDARARTSACGGVHGDQAGGQRRCAADTTPMSHTLTHLQQCQLEAQEARGHDARLVALCVTCHV
jgi:hypothetical protein